MLRKSDSDCLRSLVEFEIKKNRTPSTSPWDSLFLAFPSDLVLNISRAHADAMKLPNKTNSFTRLNTSEKFRLAVVSSDFTNHSTAHVATELLLALAEYVDADVHLICTASKERLKHSESCPYRNDLIQKFGSRFQCAVNNKFPSRINPHVVVIMGFHQDGDKPNILKGAIEQGATVVQYLAHSGTTGSRAVHGLLCDRLTAPPENQSHFSEVLKYISKLGNSV